MRSFARTILAGSAAAMLLAGSAAAGEPVTFPTSPPKIVVFKDADCFDRAGEIAVATLKSPTRESPEGAACVKIKDGTATYYVLPSAIKPPAGCARGAMPSGPKATTYGSSGASPCNRG